MLLAAPAMTLDGARPVIIGHRGAPALRPEHTLASYRLAAEQGADFIEPDLVSSKDGALVARHENEISGTTNVADLPQFASRKTTRTIDGMAVTGWFTEDFTLAELKTLRARERIPALRPANVAYNDKFEIPTLQEIINLAKQLSRETGRAIGMYPETKHPSYFASIGLPLEKTLVETLHKNGYRDRSAPVFIQSFEVKNLRELRKLTKLRLIQLIEAKGQPYDFTLADDARTYADLVTQAGLHEIATYADGIGPNKSLVIARDGHGRLAAPTPLVAWAHEAGLAVHPWTFRPENEFLPVEFQRATADGKSTPNQSGDSVGEIHRFLDTGIDGFFTDLAEAGKHAIAVARKKK
jgi:glycerophosphoryl diester phosphodiesterase